MKKASRFAALLAAVMLFGSVAAMPALAAEDVTSTPVPTATAEPTVTPAPTDNGQSAPNNSGSAYIIAQTVTDAAGGEITTIDRDSRFNLILRVADYGAYNNFIPADQISARINSSAFTFTGNAEVGQLYEEIDANGAGYYSYVLLFRDVIYNGGGNSVPINLSYLNSTMAMQQLSVTLGQCVDEDPDTPNLMIRASSYGNEAVVAGTPFTLTLTLYATGGQEDLNDVVISLTLPDGITMTSGSLSSYLGTMAPKSTRDVSFSLTPSAGFTGGVANITVNSVGTGADTNKAVTGMSTTISVPVSQPDRFELGQLELSDSITLGDSASVTLNFVNKGRNALSNLEATLSGDNLGADTTVQYIGNLNAGSSNSVDFDMTPTQEGTCNGTITLTYEDANGTLKTVSKDFSFSVQPAMDYGDSGDMDYNMDDMQPQQTGLPLWAYLAIGAAVIVVVVVIVVLVRKKKKAAALAKLEEGNDEDI